MNILCVTNYYLFNEASKKQSIGGMQISNYLIIEGLENENPDVTTLIFSKNYKNQSTDKKANTYFYNYNSSSIINGIRSLIRVLLMQKKIEPDIVIYLDAHIEKSFWAFTKVL